MENELSWDSDLITGVPDIDNQHLEVVRVLNKLNLSLRQNKDKTTIKDLISELNKYTVNHFEAEQKFMKVVGYPDDEIKKHVLSHDYFKSTYNQIMFYYSNITGSSKEQGMTYIFALHLLEVMRDWFKLHVDNFDSPFIEFVKAKNIEIKLS